MTVGVERSTAIPPLQVIHKALCSKWVGAQVFDSVEGCWRGPLHVYRRKYLRWIPIENAWHTMRETPRLQHKYLAIYMLNGSNTAKVAVAEDVLKFIYCILKERRQFRPEKDTEQSQPSGARTLAGV